MSACRSANGKTYKGGYLALIDRYPSPSPRGARSFIQAYTPIDIRQLTSRSTSHPTTRSNTRQPLTMNALRPLPSTLLRTGLRRRTRSTATLLSACRHPQSCTLARSMTTRSRALTQTQTPIATISSGRALHASAELGGRVENSTALLERTKSREEKIEEENTDNTKPVGGKGSEGIHFKRKPSHLVSQAIGYRMTKANPVLLCRIVLWALYMQKRTACWRQSMIYKIRRGPDLGRSVIPSTLPRWV
jgi:hypothetical protein